MLILEGRVQVTVGKENLIFESGPFSHFGSQALTIFDHTEEKKSPLKFLPNGNQGRAFSISEGGMISGDGGMHITSQTFISDYTVRALTDVTYLRVSQFLYQAARSATLLERAQSELVQSNSIEETLL